MDYTLNLQSPWSEVRDKLKENNIDLTDEDLVYERGKEKELIARLQRKMDNTESEIKAYIESLSANRGRAS